MDETMPADRPEAGNILATEKIGKLLVKFAVPTIISFLVSALYNIVDQIFIGQGVGILGNAATNIAFPVTTISTALALLLGIGGASNFNLELGAGRKERASHIIGNCVVLLGITGLILCAVIIIFLEPLMHAFGATENVLSHALTYTGITALGIPLVVFTAASSNLIRADGSPGYAMICMLSGAVLNTILDPIFIFVFDMGIAGAAWATVIGQAVSFVLAVRYYFNFKTVPLAAEHFKLKGTYIRAIVSLGAASCFNQLAMTVVQITMNNTLNYYGAESVYGSDIPLACVGVITKVNIVFMAFILGISQGNQPIVGFNYGARNYDRVKKAYRLAATAATIVSTIAFLCFQFLPRQIISIFGDGSEIYFRFAERFFRIYMAMMFINGIQPVTANFFTSIGKAKMGILISMTRQILFLLPLILIFPLFFGIDGVMYAGPIADGIAAVLAFYLVSREMKKMKELAAQVSEPEKADRI
ncbi:MATE family efflux transporter [Brucepastera parasyntrophica]|uniref:MATE family efflux transporter n=1 Tax=Brucepastera parasyntrophica TaxID=2880008 RepID=UPI00210BFADA|nr:MATE family efflux transporter [Brucepastera parasyntrophica]ULQ59460.1 MATE family efflux transporter [Brucepastera parasyntrophica]